MRLPTGGKSIAPVAGPRWLTGATSGPILRLARPHVGACRWSQDMGGKKRHETRKFSRSNPSPRYRELIQFYRDMHANGARNENIPPEKTFPGSTMLKRAENIRNIIEVLGSETILDYGAGKGQQYGPIKVKLRDGRAFTSMQSYWDVRSITCYDPAYPPFEAFPTGRFDGVVSTDVLEHCPREDLPWIINEIFSFADEFVYVNVACFPAVKILPNGENAHCTVEPPEWWQALFDRAAATRPGIRYFASYTLKEKGPDGRLTMVTRLAKGKSRRR